MFDDEPHHYFWVKHHADSEWEVARMDAVDSEYRHFIHGDVFFTGWDQPYDRADIAVVGPEIHPPAPEVPNV